MTNNAAPETKDEKYEPQHLKKWSPPDHWFGEEWWGWYVFIGHHRDSEKIDESNWDCILKDIGENPSAAEECKGLLIVRESHWAVGWVEWMAIHETDTELLKRCDEIKAALEDYPLYNEEDYSNRCYEEQYQAVDQMVRDFDNKLYQYVDPDTGEDLTEMTEEEIEYIVGTWCHHCNSDDQRPSDDELWSAYWKVHGHLLHCTIHGPYPDNDPCPCQMRLPLFDEAQPATTAR